MATYKIELRGKSVNIVYQVDGKRNRLPINIKVDEKKYTGIDGRWIKGDDLANITIQSRLNDLRSYVNTYFLENKSYPLPKSLTGFFNPKSIIETETFENIYNQFMHDKTHKGNQSVSFGRFKHYRSFKNLLYEFDSKIEVVKFTTKYYERFMEFLTDKDYNDNTISSKINMLKTFLNWYRKTRKTNALDDVLENMTYKKHHNDTFFHTSSELQALLTAEILQPHLAVTRDLYCLQCMTGIRFSDLISHKWVFEDDFLRKVTQKTKEEIIVPLRKSAKEIIERLKLQDFPTKSNVKFNLQIKEVGRIAGITNEVLIVKGKRKHKAGDIVPKYKLMSSHMARATFICQMIELDVHNKKIKKMTGIKKDATLDHYSEVVDTSLRDTMEKVEILQGF